MANGKHHTGSSFDEYFLNAFQFQQEMDEKRNQRVQDITFKMRELSLLDDYRQQVLAQDESQFGRTHQLAGEKHKLEGEKLTESTRQFDTGLAFDEKKLTEDTRQFNEELAFDEKELAEDIALGEKRVGVDYARINESGRQFDLMYPIHQLNAETDAQGITKEGKLSDAGSKALGFFTQPNIDYPNPIQNIIGGGEYDTPQDIKQQIADNMAVFSKDIMRSSTYQKIQNTFSEDGYLSPEELKNKMIEKNLTQQEASEVLVFLRYYDTMYDGILKLEEFAK